MLKKNITYTNFDDVTVTKEFHFHLSKAELVELAVSFDGDYSEWLKNVLANEDRKAMIETFKMLIVKSVGRRVGDRFVKTQELTDEFMQTPAYDELFLELFTDKTGGVDFIKGVFPPDMTKALDSNVELQQALAATSEEGMRDPSSYTHAEMVNMSQDEFSKTFGNDAMKWPRNVMAAAMTRKTATNQ